MKVLAFGASGGTGREVVKQALDRGHTVNAFVRDPGKFEIKHAKLALMVGDVTEYALVERAVSGQDAIASALGSGNSLSSAPALVDGVQNIVRAMNYAGVRRVRLLVNARGRWKRQATRLHRQVHRAAAPVAQRGGRSREKGRCDQAKHAGLGHRTSSAIDERALHREISKRRGCQGEKAPGVNLTCRRRRFHGEAVYGRPVCA